LKGDKDAVYYCDPNNPQGSTYAQRFKGMQLTDFAKILDDGRTSFAGPTIPDPATMTMTSLKFREIENDRMRMTRRMFTNNGMTTLSPKAFKAVQNNLEFKNNSHYDNTDKKVR
jgi:hypothetical protein